MEEMQEALRGKSRRSQAIDCMLSEAECSFSTDSLDDRAIRDEGSQRDSSTMISEFSSTRTLMNIDDEGKRCFEEEDSSQKGFFLSRRFSDSTEIEQEITSTKYSWEMNIAQRGTILDQNIENSCESKSNDKYEIRYEQKSMDKKMKGERLSKVVKKKKSESLEEKTVTKRSAETKSLSTTVSMKSRRDGSSTSKSSNMQKVKLSKPLTLEKSTSPIRGTIVTTVKARSPSPVRAKCSKINESTSSEKLRKATGKSNSPSPTRLEKSKAIKSADKLVAVKLGKSVKLKEETHAFDTTSNDETINKTTQNIDKISVEKDESKMESLRTQRKKKIVLDFDEFPPPRTEKRSHVHSEHLNVPETGIYLSPIEENSEASTGSGQNKFATEHYGAGKMMETTLEYDHARKYHTYPKSRIPVARWSKERRFGNLMMDPKMYPLEPREIDLEAFQQLHTADSQEELQEFLLLESQCSGNLGLAGNMSTSEVSCSEHHSEDERGTMSGILVDRITNNIATG